MSNEWLYSSERCDYCNGELLLLFNSYEVGNKRYYYEKGNKKYCCKECADDANTNNKNGKRR